MIMRKRIIEAAKPYADEPTRYLGFMDGATWADAHPHWISVKDYATDELPPLIDTSKVNKVILRGMLDEFKQYFEL